VEEPRLPLPGGNEPWGELVDAYVQHHGITRAECFRRVAAETGNSVNALGLRYRQRHGKPWYFAAPLGTWSSPEP
jgi:hypothetical protein